MGKHSKLRQANIRQLIICAVLLVFLGLFLTLKYSHSGTLKLAFSAEGPAFWLEVADTDAARARGLMFRKTLPDDSGMFFAFPETKNQRFWMRDTFIPLDIIFLNEGLQVVGVLKNVPIMNETIRSVDAPSRYVVELKAGMADKLGLKEGSKAMIIKGQLPKGT